MCFRRDDSPPNVLSHFVQEETAGFWMTGVEDLEHLWARFEAKDSDEGISFSDFLVSRSFNECLTCAFWLQRSLC